MSVTLPTGLAGKKNVLIFAMLWVITFVLYVPAVKAGWVIDASGFLYNLKREGFWDFVNRTHSPDHSFYQVLTLQYWIFYKIWGLNFWGWGLLYISAQAVNAYLLYILCRNIFTDSGVRNSAAIALSGAVLFTVCPHISEIVICKAYYHYLQSFMFILLAMLLVQKYQHRQEAKYMLGAAAVFILSAMTLEIFYLVPFFTLSIILYYRFALGFDAKTMQKSLYNFFSLQIILLGLYFVALFAVYQQFVAHKVEVDQPVLDYLTKGPKYIFNIVFLGRYFPVPVKKAVDTFCNSLELLLVFYSLVAGAFVYAIMSFSKLNNVLKVLLLVFVWAAMAIAFVTVMPFPGVDLLVFYDRYTYFADGFIYMLLALAVGSYLNRYIGLALFAIYAVINIFFTIKLNMYWKHSAYVTNRLLRDVPPMGDKTVILLNLPENMVGIPMIGAQPDGEFKALHEIYTGNTIKNTVYDALSYNMITEKDGAHITVSNDSTIHVTLNSWGEWWWYEGHGAKSYENADYKVNLIDPGHWYELTLKKPASQYLLLYQIGDQWKVVDMSKRNEDQW